MPGGIAGFSSTCILLLLTIISDNQTMPAIPSPNPAAHHINPVSGWLQKLGWTFVRLIQDIFAPPQIPVALPQDFPWQVRKARFWELMDVTHFDHLSFPKNNHKLDTFFYLLKMKLAGGASIFTVRDPKAANRLIGTVYLRHLRQPGVGFISNVAVHQHYRRQGLAEFMMLKLALPEVQQIGFKRLVLNVISNSFVQSFYEKLGFHLYTGNQFEIHTPLGESPMDMNLM